MITIPGGYHFGFNTGFNVAEATNFGVPEWIPFGREAKICMCRPDSVRIDMLRLERLLDRYRRETRKTTSRRRKSWRDWGIMHDEKYKKDSSSSESSSDEESDDEMNNNDKTTTPNKRTKKVKKDFWVEVMCPVPSSQRGIAGVGRARKKKSSTPRKRARSKGGKQQPKGPVEEKEVWHLAKPMTRKALVLNAKVLVMIPGVVASNNQENSPAGVGGGGHKGIYGARSSSSSEVRSLSV